MRIEIFKDKQLISVIDDVIELKVCGDEWFIKSKSEFFESNIKFNAKNKNNLNVIYG